MHLFVTENEGASWEQISPDLTTNDKTKQAAVAVRLQRTIHRLNITVPFLQLQKGTGKRSAYGQAVMTDY